MVESDINVSKIKFSASNTATTADAPFILDQKRSHCDPKIMSENQLSGS